MAGYQPEKRLVVCCDGTWNDSVSTDSPLTNVSRFSRCVEAIGEDGILQIVYYHTGVGSGTSKLSNSIDGATGRGLSRNIRDAYSFICNNYNFEGGNDEIHLVGFSRGAFTVRCVASLIDSIGLLTKPGLVHLHDLYHSWEKLDNNKEDLISQVTELEEKGLLRRKIQVEACAVWDTVSALGVPIPFGIPQPKSPKLAFVDAEVPHTVKNAFHALALHERRKHFKPLLWHSPSQDHINLRQCWFWGVHSDVGGGYEDAGLANLALIWMVAQFQRATKLHFNMDTLLRFLIPDKLIESTTGRNLHISTSVFGIQYGYQERNIRIRSKIDKGT
ncbi:hypothetical protein BCR34DRAFT_471960 [Clohesyomyces aquaticus]|uniref:T6SS Phospholipase effector Tle1-like catalytic domain-containing protein n=1 Tax=Clohesyomyces aquaticus TaxID=1231657 RepID=A0A1Y2AAW9_9PLEO|nr:hypothetical protein BCR34DRAFT_471960 [Clohesyomyces aquaticus]